MWRRDVTLRALSRTPSKQTTRPNAMLLFVAKVSFALALSFSRITQSVIRLPKKNFCIKKTIFDAIFLSRARNKYSLARPKKRNFEVESLARGENFSRSLFVSTSAFFLLIRIKKENTPCNDAFLVCLLVEFLLVCLYFLHTIDSRTIKNFTT